jgi:hypothetical protein
LNLANPLTAAIERERNHPHKVRRAWAALRGVTALHEAAHVAAGYRYAPWGWIEIPFKDPIRAHARNSCLSTDQDVVSFFAGCVMDRIIFDHGLFALHDLIAGMETLIRGYAESAHDI